MEDIFRPLALLEITGLRVVTLVILRLVLYGTYIPSV